MAWHLKWPIHHLYHQMNVFRQGFTSCLLTFCCFFSSQVCQRMRVPSPRLVAQPKYQGSSAARSRATVRCPSHLPCLAPPRLRRLRAPLPPLQRRRPLSPLGRASPPRLLSVSRRSSNLRPLSLPLPCWGHHPTPCPTLLTHTRTRSPVFFRPHSTTRGQ